MYSKYTTDKDSLSRYVIQDNGDILDTFNNKYPSLKDITDNLNLLNYVRVQLYNTRTVIFETLDETPFRDIIIL